MLLLEKMMNLEKETPSQKAVIDFMIEKKSDIEDLSARDIAKIVYTSPATLTRLSKKLGYNGFEELKKDFLKEQTYLDKNRKNIDANIPFKKGDNLMSIANNIGNLVKESVDDTLSLMHYEYIKNTVDILNKAETIHISGISFSMIYAKDFQLKMRRLGKRVEVIDLVGEQLYTYPIIQPNDCAIIISYSGEIPLLKQMAQLYHNKKIPLIVITSLGENTLRKYADITIDITTREKLYSKISAFSSHNSIKLILDIIYACYFSLNYDKNLKLIHDLGKMSEPGRYSTTKILNEE